MIIGINGYIGSGKDTVGSIIQYLTDHPKSKNQTDGKNRSYNSYVMDVGMGWTPSWEIKKFAEKLKQIASLLTGIPRERFEDQEFKKTFLPEQWNYDKPLDRDTMLQEQKYWESVPMTVREFLQKLGTEGLRDGLHSNVWVNALFADYEPELTKQSEGYYSENTGMLLNSPPEYDYPNWIITDTRFPNEAQGIKERGGIVIRVNRYCYDSLEDFLVCHPNEGVHNKAVKIVAEYEGSYADFEETLRREIPEAANFKNKKEFHASETGLDDWKFDYVIENNGTIPDLIEKVRDMLKQFNIIS